MPHGRSLRNTSDNRLKSMIFGWMGSNQGIKKSQRSWSIAVWNRIITYARKFDRALMAGYKRTWEPRSDWGMRLKNADSFFATISHMCVSQRFLTMNYLLTTIGQYRCNTFFPPYKWTKGCLGTADATVWLTKTFVFQRLRKLPPPSLETSPAKKQRHPCESLIALKSQRVFGRLMF